MKRGDFWPHVWRDRPVQLFGSGVLRYFRDEDAREREVSLENVPFFLGCAFPEDFVPSF